jgi:hypothetical protein
VNDCGARLLVWSVWTGMLALLVWSTHPWLRAFHWPEDWLTVAPLTGHEPDLARWFWEQNNEHRMPVARLLLLLISFVSCSKSADLLVSCENAEAYTVEPTAYR